MIIWKGHGILILVFGVIGGVVAGMVAGLLFGVTQWTWMGRLMMCAPFWGAAAAIWAYAKTLGKPTEKTFLDPATHQPVVIRSSHSLFFIPPLPWAIIATILAVVMSFSALIVPASTFDSDGMAASSDPGVSAFHEANRLIATAKGGEAHGNTPDAEKLAAQFAAMVSLGRKLGVEAATTKSSLSLSKGKFLTYCRINPDSCAFMVHVPDLRKFSKDAKEFIADIAWATALESARSLKPQPSKIAIGVRGVLLYDTVIVGHIVAEDAEPDTGIEQRFTSVGSEKNLADFFKDTALDAALPRLKNNDEPEADSSAKKTADAAPQTALSSVPAGTTLPASVATSSTPAPPSRDSVSAAASPSRKVEILLKWFPTTKPGEVAGNADAGNQVALKYAGFVHDRVSMNPDLGGMSLPDSCFSAYVHLRDDTAAFLLALPAGSDLSDLSEGALKVIQDQAWRMAAMLSAQMSPIPARIAVITFIEGQIDLTRFGSPRNQEGTEWLVEQELSGDQGKDFLPPFVSALSGQLITVQSPLTMQGSVKSLLAANRHMRAAVPAPAVPAVASVSPPLLPTPVRDWKDSTGRVMQASLESFTTSAKEVGRFKRADGQLFEVPFSRLSAEDQEFIRSLAAPMKP